MRAVVLVGGEGTRLRPLTLTMPKQMLPIVEQPMIERVLGHLHSHGIDDAVLSLGYLPTAFLRAYPDGVAAGVRLSYAVEPEPLDTAGAIRFAAAHASVDDTFVVVNGDVLTDMDLSAVIAFHRSHGAQGTVALHPVPDPSAFGVVPTDESGRVIAFVEKPPRDEAPTNLINAGTYVLEPSFLERVPTGRRVSIERETFPAMVEDGCLYAIADEAYWLDTGTPQDYLAAHHDLLEDRSGEPPVDGARRTEQGSWVLGHPRLAGEVVGACFAADGADVAAGARIERSILGPGCVVEAGAVVRGSVLMAGARVAAGAHVEGSVLGHGSTIGERSIVRAVSVVGAGASVAPGATVDAGRVAA